MRRILFSFFGFVPLIALSQINILNDSAFRMKMPDDTTQFKKSWHNNPVSQGYTGTCWCFGAISMAESEIYRQTRQQVKLSEMYIVYWEYVEKARRFVQEKGKSAFEEASEANAVPRMMKIYGTVPATAYTGIKGKADFYYHIPMLSEMKKYLAKVKDKKLWDEKKVILKIRAILDKYMGRPPETITADDVVYTPLQYMEKVLKFKPDDYFSFMSTMNISYNQKGELVEEDNWWHDRNYYNVRISDFMGIVFTVLDKGYTLTICGDISEPGIDGKSKVILVPYCDIAPQSINEASRQFRLDNKTTTDDHCLHLVGYYKNTSGTWFLVKDSGDPTTGKLHGYWFMHEDYLKLKMMTILVNKTAASFILDKIIK